MMRLTALIGHITAAIARMATTPAIKAGKMNGVIATAAKRRKIGFFFVVRQTRRPKIATMTIHAARSETTIVENPGPLRRAAHLSAVIATPTIVTSNVKRSTRFIILVLELSAVCQPVGNQALRSRLVHRLFRASRRGGDGFPLGGLPGSGSFIGVDRSEMLTDFRRKLAIGQFVGRFQLDGADPKFLALDALAELALGFAGSKDQN
jgi:hypothetical protein